jgi:hypothetical protein
MPEPDLFVSLQSSLGCGTLEWLALALADVLMLLAGTQKPSTAGGKSFFFSSSRANRRKIFMHHL